MMDRNYDLWKEVCLSFTCWRSYQSSVHYLLLYMQIRDGSAFVGKKQTGSAAHKLL